MLGTVLVVILIIILLGGFSGVGGGPFYGGGNVLGGGLGLVLVIFDLDPVGAHLILERKIPMGLNAEAAKKSAEDLKAARAKMEKDNLAQMEALAKEQPEPSVETLQRAMGVPVRKQETKTSEPVQAADKAGYQTRASTPASAKAAPPHLVRDEKEVDKK